MARAVASAAVVALVACGDGNDATKPEAPRAVSLSVAPNTVQLAGPGESELLEPIVLDQYGSPFAVTLTWTSDDASVVAVDQSGAATAVSPGTAAIRVAAGTLSADAQVSVAASARSGVCDRTARVREAITAAAGAADCTQVTEVSLRTITRLDLNGPDPESPATSSGDHCARGRDFGWERGTRDCSSKPPGRPDPRSDGASHSDGEAPAIISSLRSGDLRGLHGLRTLELRWNLLRTLPRDVFADLGNLTELDLRDNRLATLPQDIFDPLGTLERLALSDNALTSLPDGVAGLVRLAHLDLHDNWITSLREGIFADLSMLTTLDLHENHLQDLPEDVFDDLGALERLDLSDNRLSDLPRAILDSQARLERLDLSSNRLTKLSDGVFDNLANLERLDLSSNRLAELPVGIFDRLARLERLYLSSNRLTGLADGVFDRLARLEMLSMSANDLTELPAGVFDRLANLSYLSLRSNDLAELRVGVFNGSPKLTQLHLYRNELTALPPGVFAGLSKLEILWLEDNVVDPFPLAVEPRRTDGAGASAAGPARIAAVVREGAPFDMQIEIAVHGATPASAAVTITAGDTISEAVTVQPTRAAASRYVVIEGVPANSEDQCRGWPCFEGVRAVAGDHPLVLANPESVGVYARIAYLTQEAQSPRSDVPLVADRQALLRAFVTATEPNSYRAPAIATFFLADEVVYRTDLAAPPGIPAGGVDESGLGLSFNALVPGSVVQPGLEMVVEVDPEGTLPTSGDSWLRIPATGRMALDVRRLAPLDVTLVPVAFASEASAADNERVHAFVRDLANGIDPHGALHPARALLPAPRLNINAREPYVSHSDTLDNGGSALLAEIQLLRHIEAGTTDEYYHGIIAHPSSRFPSAWDFAGRAYVAGSAALTFSHLGGRFYSGFADTFAHELGHNLSLEHTPCGDPSDIDPDYPHANASTGVWGVDFSTGGEFGRLLSPARYKDFMSYCGPAWTSDYSFVKAFEYRARFPRPGENGTAAGKTLLVWGRIGAAGELHLEPVFEWVAPAKLPASPGPYRVEGLDAAGGRFFSLSFSPDQIDHGGAGFLFAVPIEAGWADELDRVTLTGPGDFVALDRDNAAVGAIVTSRRTGRVRSILRAWPDSLPDTLGSAAEVFVRRAVAVGAAQKKQRY